MDKHQTSTAESSSITSTQEGAENQSGAQQFQQASQTVKETATAVTSTVKDTASQVASAAKGTVQDIASEAQASATEIVEEAKTSAQVKVSEQRIQLASQLDTMAKALRETGDRLQNEEHQAVAQYTNLAADQVQRLAGYLQESDISVIVSDLSDFARRQPGVFLATTLTAGFFLGRFLKSSSQRPMRRGNGDSNGGYGPQGYGSSSYRPGNQWSRSQSSGYQAGQSGTEFSKQPVPGNAQQGWASLGDSQIYPYPSDSDRARGHEPSADWLPEGNRGSEAGEMTVLGSRGASGLGAANQGATDKLTRPQGSAGTSQGQAPSGTRDWRSSSQEDAAPHGSGSSEEFQGE